MKKDFTLDMNTVDRVAELARLSLSEQEREAMLGDMRDMLKFASVILDADTDGVTPMEHILPLKNVLREDICKAELDRDALIAAAPDTCDGYVRVLTVIKEQAG